MNSFPNRVEIIEVGPRDGLQNETTPVSEAIRLSFIQQLTAAGLKRIEVGACVRPDRVPQMAGSEAILSQLDLAAAEYVLLVPNPKGYERAKSAGARSVAVFAAATESFSKANLGASIDDVMSRLSGVVSEGITDGMRVRGYLSTCFFCPYEGEVDVNQVATLSEKLIELGCFEVAISDTVGAATPRHVDSLLDVLLPRIGTENIALHFHDTRGTALANVLAALNLGITKFDASAGGLGGCPFAPGALGNLATEDLIYMLDGMGIETGVDLEQVSLASLEIERVLQKKLPARVIRAGNFKALGERR